MWAALATVAGVWPGFLTDSPSQGLMDAYSFSSRTEFEAIAFGSIAVILAIGVLFYVLGTPTRRAAGGRADPARGGSRDGGGDSDSLTV